MICVCGWDKKNPSLEAVWILNLTAILYQATCQLLSLFSDFSVKFGFSNQLGQVNVVPNLLPLESTSLWMSDQTPTPIVLLMMSDHPGILQSEKPVR